VESDTLTDGELISLSLHESQAFIQVFERHYDPVRRYLQRRVGIEAGEELAAGTFEVAFSRRSSFNPEYPSARPWLFGIATNLLRHHVRQERAKRSAFERIPVPRMSESDPRLDARLAAISLEDPLREALRSLRIEDRDALCLFAVAELTYEEIGLALAIPIGTVRSRLNRARTRIRMHPALLEAAQDFDEQAFKSVGGVDGRA
jgi:RNA polymerase sigma factor (sigma-70 family)